MGKDGVNTNIVETGGNRMSLIHIAFVILQKIGFVALSDTDTGIIIGQAR